MGEFMCCMLGHPLAESLARTFLSLCTYNPPAIPAHQAHSYAMHRGLIVTTSLLDSGLSQIPPLWSSTTQPPQLLLGQVRRQWLSHAHAPQAERAQVLASGLRHKIHSTYLCVLLHVEIFNRFGTMSTMRQSNIDRRRGRDECREKLAQHICMSKIQPSLDELG